MSNYSYGRNAERKVGQVIVKKINGSSFRRSAGSRTASDVQVYSNGIPKYSIQVKSSRAATKVSNTNSKIDTQKVIIHAAVKGTTALVANCKGKSMEVRYATSGKLMLKK